MVRLAHAAVALLAAAGIASAGPVTVGAGLGITQDQTNSGQDPNSTLSAFGRLALTHRFGVELDLAKVDTSSGYAAKMITGLAVLDLGDSVHWVPHVFAGLGYDQASVGYGDIQGHHFEGGLGLEYRTDGGFTIGARFHIGGRSIDSSPGVYPLACCLYEPTTLQASEYRSLDAYAGIRF
ncbi:MAG: outer membrane beta-barrel protein [Deltaproteobacteria bacterium]